MNRYITTFTFWFLAALLVFSAGCTYFAPETADEELLPVSTIGILPAQPVRQQLAENGTAKELEAGTETINGLLADYFADDQRAHFIPQGELEKMAVIKQGDDLFFARAAGQKYNFDTVMITTVNRYREREGSEYVVTTPASVSFSFKLLAVESGRIIWSSDFDQTQKPLFENILRSRSTGSGFRWLTAAQLASAGLTRKLNSCPYLKRD
jgi:hypothetical protein